MPTEHREQIGGVEAFWRRAEPDAGGAPVLYLHGVPTSADDWLPFLERTGGIAPDLPGFGRSGKPASFDYSIPGYDRWLEAFLDHAGPRPLLAGGARLGRAWGSPRRSGCPSGWSGWW